MLSQRFIFLVCVLLFSSNQLRASKDPEHKKNGLIIVYYPGTNQICSTGINKNYQREGIWKYYAVNGDLSRTEEWSQDKLNGTRKIYLRNVLIAEENFKENLLQGIQHYNYSDGSDNRIFWFTSGNPDSSLYFINGYSTPAERITYSGKLITSIKRYQKNGALIETEYYEAGLKSGTWVTYPLTEFGERKETTYKNGLKEGIEKAYINGELAYETQYRNGKRNGFARVYLRTKVISEAEYKNDRLTGISSLYQPISGVLLSRKYWSDSYSTFNESLPDSSYEYYTSGKLKTVSRYEHTFQNGKTTSTGAIVNYYENGMLSGTYTTKDGLKEGKEIKYYSNGKKQILITWIAGKAEGPITAWYENGTTKLSLSIQSGEITVGPNVFAANGKPITAGTDDFKMILAELPYEIMNHAESQQSDSPWDTIQQIEELPVKVEEPPFDLPIYDDVTFNDIFQGGDSAFAQFVEKQTVYPAADRYFNNSGMIILSLTLSPDGSVLDTYILMDKTNSFALQNEALRLMYCTPWKNPSSQKITINIPLNFKLKN